MLIIPVRTGFLNAASGLRAFVLCFMSPGTHATQPASAGPVAVDYPRAGAVTTALAIRFTKTGGDYGFCRR